VFDIATFWYSQQMRELCPQLYRAAVGVLSIPSSSDSSERLLVLTRKHRICDLHFEERFILRAYDLTVNSEKWESAKEEMQQESLHASSGANFVFQHRGDDSS